jgi:phenylacetate-CoA ligase
MSIYSRFVGDVVLPRVGGFFNPHFPAYLSEWSQSQYWDPQRLEAYRWERFHRLLTHASQTVPFYRNHFREAGLKPSDFRSFQDLDKLPTLSKDDYHDHGLDAFTSEAVSKSSIINESTSGTSGRPFAFRIDETVVASKMARLIRENAWANWRVGDRYVRLWGEHRESFVKKTFYRVLMRRVELPAFEIDDRFDEIVATFRRLRPRIMEAYTSAAVQLARCCRDRGVRLPMPESVIVSAETLIEPHRALIVEHVGGRVFNRYGSREFGNVAQECAEGHFHINAESFHVEAQPHPEIQDASNLVITFLDNYTMPLIRYRCGDLGKLATGTCPCGRTLPLLSSVEGRSTDFFLLSGGRSLSFLYFNHFFEQAGGVVDLYQVEQRAEDDMLVRLVPGPRYSEASKTEICNRLQARFGHSPRFDVTVVSDLPREDSGKLRIYKPLRKAASTVAP